MEGVYREVQRGEDLEGNLRGAQVLILGAEVEKGMWEWLMQKLAVERRG
jgi:hypothetical protein